MSSRSRLSISVIPVTTPRLRYSSFWSSASNPRSCAFSAGADPVAASPCRGREIPLLRQVGREVCRNLHEPGVLERRVAQEAAEVLSLSEHERLRLCSRSALPEFPDDIVPV